MSVPATVVANSFVKQYYGILAQKPEQLYKFYKAQSVFSFSRGAQGGGQTGTISAVGQEEIRAKITATLRPFNGHFCKAEIIGIDSQESRQGGVLVLVTGYLVISGTAATQHFTQSFFLDKQTTPYEGYFVLNDILRYLPPTAATATTTLPRPAMPQSPSAESPARTPAAAPGAPSPQVHPSMMQPLQRPQGQESPSLASWLYQAEQQMPAVSAAQDIPDGEVDERVAEVSLDIEDEEEEEERPQDVELEEDAAEEEGADVPQEEALAQPPQEEQLSHPPDEAAEASEEPLPQPPEEATEEAAEAAEEATEADAEAEGQEEEEEQEQSEAPPPAEEQEGWAKIDEAAGSTERLDGESLASYFLVEEAPRTWASLAGRLQEGGGQLRPSKVQGYACPAASTASRAGQNYLPHFASGTAAAGADSGYAGSQQRAGKGGGTSSSSRPTHVASSHVWLWVSRLPSDPAAESQEILDSLNSFLVEWGCDGRATEVDRRDPQQEWASIQVTNQEAADTLLALSKDRGLLLRGKPLKADLHRFTFGPRRQGRGGGGEGRGAARGGGGVSGSGREDDRLDSGGKTGESRGGGRPRRKPRGPIDGRDRFSGGNSSGSYSEFGAKGYGKK